MLSQNKRVSSDMRALYIPRRHAQLTYTMRMAMFREHIGFGAIVSAVLVVAVYSYALMTDWGLLAVLFLVAVLGSFLPDVDSDSGLPFHLVFGTATVAAGGATLAVMLEASDDWRIIAGISLAVLVFTWVVVGGVIKRFTKHRGIFHSIPAAVIAGLGTYLVAEHLALAEQPAVIFGVGMGAGYIAHLTLDELHAGITLDGIPFNPKSSLGSALKLFSRSGGVNIATYSLLATLFYSAYY